MKMIEPNGPGSLCVAANETMTECFVSAGPVVTWAQLWPVLLLASALTILVLGGIVCFREFTASARQNRDAGKGRGR